MAGQEDPLVEALRLLVDARLGRTPPPSERAGVLAVWRDVWRGREAQAPEAARAYLRDARWWPAPGEVLRLAPAPVVAAAPAVRPAEVDALPARVRAERAIWSQWSSDRLMYRAFLVAGYYDGVAERGPVPAFGALLAYLREMLDAHGIYPSHAVEAVREGERRLRAAGALPPLERWTWAPLVADVWGAA